MSEPAEAEPSSAPAPPRLPASLFDRMRALASPARLAAALVGGGAAVALVVAALAPAPAPPELTLPQASSDADAGGTSGRAPSDGERVVVHAAGAVRTPGVYRLANGARVGDLLEAAGGALPEADLDSVNLAQPLVDGERVYVPRRGEAVPVGGGATAAAKPAGPLDLNRATADELDGLPGVGPATAAAIVEHRGRVGRFRSVDDLLDVPGIGDAKLARLRPLVKV